MQQYPLLATKLYRPPVRVGSVARPRLITRLHLGLGQGQSFARKLTLISAPAGFGKTSLVTEWIQSLRELANPVAVAWLSLDENDTDPQRFLTYVIEAIRRVDGIVADFGNEALNWLQSSQPAWETVLISLINEISTISTRVVLVLDDYHQVENLDIQSLLTFLLEHLPQQLHLVIVTREDPLLPISRLRVRRMLTELRAKDLRFSSVEVAIFLNQVMGISLNQADIDALEDRTEGWIAGLQLAALSMQGQSNVSGFIRSFTGSHRFVLDYLIEEVLEQQSEATQIFLLQTSILNRMTGELCDALTGQHNGYETLIFLERANLFMVPLDQERSWYRYHHLFADLLQQRLRMTRPDAVQVLHRKAAAWYEAAGYRDDAIQHALAGNDMPTTIRLMEAGAEDALERSDFNFIFKCVSQLPETALLQAPWLYMYHCWALILIGRIDETGARVANSDWLLSAVAENENQLHTMQGYIAGLQEQLYGWKRDYHTMREYADQAIALMPANHWITAYCYMGQGVAYWGEGNLDAATDVFAKADTIGKITANARVALTSSIYLMHALELQGHLTEGIALMNRVIQRFTVDGRALPVTAYAHTDISRIYIERNELDLAQQHLITGIEYCRVLGDTRVGKLGHYLMARLQIARCEFDAALTSIADGDALHAGTELTVDMRGTDYPQVRLWLAQGKLYELETWLQSCDLDVKAVNHFKTRLIFTMHARVMLALHNANLGGTYLKHAQTLLRTLYEDAHSHGWHTRVVEILALQALAYDAQGVHSQALSTLKQVLDMAAPECYTRTFVDEGPAMARLLYEALSCDIQPAYVRKLLAAFPETREQMTEPQSAAGKTLIEPLSDRELEVLLLIADGMTNPEIAKRLYLSLNTIKVHTRNIYGKLGVNNRTQAATRAKMLGLIA